MTEITLEEEPGLVRVARVMGRRVKSSGFYRVIAPAG